MGLEAEVHPDVDFAWMLNRCRLPEELGRHHAAESRVVVAIRDVENADRTREPRAARRCLVACNRRARTYVDTVGEVRAPGVLGRRAQGVAPDSRGSIVED